jgi:hypothetical protein
MLQIATESVRNLLRLALTAPGVARSFRTKIASDKKDPRIPARNEALTPVWCPNPKFAHTRTAYRHESSASAEFA